MNSWSFTGNLGGDAETRFTPGGDAVVSFSVAVTYGYGDKQTTTWVRCVMFGKRGESVAPYLVKGTKVGIVGEASLKSWSKKDGTEASTLEVRVNDLTLLGSKPESQPAQRKATAANYAKAKQGDAFDDDSDVPF